MALDAILVSDALRRVLIHFIVHPDRPLHFRALERHLGIARQSLRNALDRLESLGLIRSRTEGQRVVYTAADHPGWRPLREMVRVFGDPAEVLRDLLADVPGIEAAFVFGSAAGDTMRPDSDVDLFVIGEEVDRDALGAAVLDAGVALGREVDLKHYTPTKLRDAASRPGTGYLQRVLAGPKRWMIGSPEALALA